MSTGSAALPTLVIDYVMFVGLYRRPGGEGLKNFYGDLSLSDRLRRESSRIDQIQR